MSVLRRLAALGLLAALVAFGSLQPALAKTHPPVRLKSPRPPVHQPVHTHGPVPAPARGQELPYVTIGYHTIRAGDTLWSIARRYLGDPHAWSTLAKANEVDPRRLQVGFVLTLVLPNG